MSREKEYVKSLSRMINIETVNNGEESLVKFDKFQDLLKELFSTVFSTFKFELFHHSILLSYIVKSEKLPVLFMSHQDVVEPNGEWTHEPFNAKVDDGKLYGRGTLDTKGNLFFILQSLEELFSSGFKPTRSIYIESSCNEETTQEGAKEITDELKKRGVKLDFVMDEGGMIVENFLFNKANKLAVVALGEKATVDLKFVCRKHGGHSSTPDKDSSLLTLTRFIKEVNNYKGFKVDIADITHEMLKALGKDAKGIVGFILRHTRNFPHFSKFLLNHLGSYTRAMVRTTVAFTMIKGSEATNVIPEESYVVANLRVSQKEGTTSAINKLRKIAEKYNIETVVLDPGYESTYSDPKSKQFAYLKDKITKHFPNVTPIPFISFGASDAKYMSQICDNVFRFAPVSIDNQQLDSIHSIEENIDVSSLVPAVDFYKDIMKDL